MPLYESRKYAENTIPLSAQEREAITLGPQLVLRRILDLLQERYAHFGRTVIVAFDGWYGVDWPAIVAGLQKLATENKLVLVFTPIVQVFQPVSVMSPAPLHLLLGYGPLLDSLLVGYRFVVAESMHPGKILEIIEQEKVGVLIVSPTMTLALLKSRELARRDLSSLIAVMIGSALCPPELVRRAARAFRCSIHIVFGATEIGGSSLMTTAFDPRRMRRETVGRPLLKNMTKIVDDQRREIPPGIVGELAQRLPSNMLGYHNSPALTAGALDEEGWYYTGDQAVMDERGYVRIVGRKKDMIIRGGQNVFPAEIEQFLLSREGIKNAAAVGLPHPLLGESLWLFVELQEDSPLTAEGIMALCREHLSPSKRPDRVKIVDALPVTASGKVQKYLLRDMAVAHE